MSLDLKECTNNVDYTHKPVKIVIFNKYHFCRSCVRVVKSEKAGMGKSLYKTRLAEKLLESNANEVLEGFPLSMTIPLSQKQIEMSEVSSKILTCTLPDDVSYPRIFHIDIAYGVTQYT